MPEQTEEIDLEDMFASKTGVYALRVRGDSMVDDHLVDGDIVVIERRDTAKNGERVVATLDTGESFVALYCRNGKQVSLDPSNYEMGPFVVDADRCRVQGVVIGVLRTYAN